MAMFDLSEGTSGISSIGIPTGLRAGFLPHRPAMAPGPENHGARSPVNKTGARPAHSGRSFGPFGAKIM
jgi:hypothetical protein